MFFSRFVVKHPSSHYRAERTAQKGNTEKDFFGNSIPFVFGLEFIHAVQYERDYRKYQDNYKHEGSRRRQFNRVAPTAK